MSSRPILSRPRTRVYNANYNIGESYYRPALDRLDRKYSGRPLSPPPARSSYFPQDVADRHDRAFFDEGIDSFRKRAEKTISGETYFDSRGARISAAASSRAADLLENGIDEETAASLRRIRANKKVSIIDDVDLESTVNNLNTRRMVERSEKVLNSVGLNDSSRRALNDEVSYKKRSLRVTYDDDVSNKDLTRWTPVEREESAASVRAKATRARIDDIDEEMAAMAEKQAARERRAARLKAFMAETAEENEAVQSALQKVSISARKERQSIEF